MPAHVKAMLNGVSLHVPVTDGKLALGTWQGIYLVEHRRKAAQPRDRAAIHRQPEVTRQENRAAAQNPASENISAIAHIVIAIADVHSANV